MSETKSYQAKPRAIRPMRGRGMPVPKGSIKKGTLKRLLKMTFKYYKWQLILVFVCIALSSVGSLVSSVYMQQLVDGVITPAMEEAGFTSVLQQRLVGLIMMMVAVYAIVIIASFVHTRLMATVTQGMLYRLRTEMFAKMQTLPIKYFDTHAHGEIMSAYTNDTDATRQLIGHSLPNLFSSSLTLITTVALMLSYSFWLSLVVGVGTLAMTFVVKKIGGNSAKYMVAQQTSLAQEEGFVEEMMKGQKVVKVFTHEEKAKEEFNAYNERLFKDSERAHIFGNILGPILGNIGNLNYVLLSITGGLLFALNATNYGFSNLFTGGGLLGIGVIVAFLGMSRNFTQIVNQMSQQISMIAMGLAGASRVFTLMDEESEKDGGYVTLVNAKEDENGELSETAERTGVWAWKHYHKADGTTTYTKLQGAIVMDMVDFSYVPEKQVLSDVSLYAKPGQKIAFVGATGAGKTTVTNLINRFYDIEDGKIRYDGININKIKKSDLRRSLGIVLQDTNLFTGTIMENIRYGRLDATDEECIEAAKLANADDFICRLPDGYQTMLTNNGANLSQGQRQLLSIARAAVADAPAMILDEATSSIDTRTEALVQDGMDKLMHGRTVFVIAHRLSTVRNSDAIMVLDHGKIIERGTHEQLIEQKGTYYQLYTGAFELE
ncbi:MAG: ABC transporter ATP-binding protein [Clostridiales bacterium]|nr:ABC transporter ATP-binding protein [Clostridiales bacterium]